MSLTEQAAERAAALAGELEAHQRQLLTSLCAAAAATVRSRLRAGVTEESCGEDFLTAVSLLALGNLREAMASDGVSEFRAGDLTIRKGGGEAASQCLRQQAWAVMEPYLTDRFCFRGV